MISEIQVNERTMFLKNDVSQELRTSVIVVSCLTGFKWLYILLVDTGGMHCAGQEAARWAICIEIVVYKMMDFSFENAEFDATNRPDGRTTETVDRSDFMAMIARMFAYKSENDTKSLQRALSYDQPLPLISYLKLFDSDLYGNQVTVPCAIAVANCEIDKLSFLK